jgi:hypothetical protein
MVKLTLSVNSDFRNGEHSMPSYLQQMKNEHGNFIESHPGTYVFVDGFKLQGSLGRGSDLFQMIEPADDLARLRAQHEYFTAALSKEEKDWYSFKTEAEQQAQLHLQNPSFCPSAPPDAVEQLEAGRDRIRKLREQIAEIEEQLPDNKAKERQEERDSRRYSEALKHRNQISAIEL